MRVIKILVGLSILLYAATMGYLWNEVRSTANSGIKAAEPFASITYDSIYVSPLGNEVGLDNIIIRPTITHDEFRIEKLRLSAPHIGYFVNAASSLDSGTFPDSVGMQLNGMHIDMDSEIFSMVEQMQQNAPKSPSSNVEVFLSSLDALGCGTRDAFTFEDYRRMGMGNIVADAIVNIENDAPRNHARVEVIASSHGLYDIAYTADFDNAAMVSNGDMLTSSIPASRISYRDTGYHKLRNDYCAGLNDSSVEAYVDRHIQLFSEKLGATLPEQTVSAYRQFMLNGGPFDISFNLVSEQSLTGLQYYKPADIIDMLRLEITIGDTMVDTRQIAWSETPPATAAKPTISENKPQRSADARPRPRVRVKENRTVRTSPSPSFRIIDPSDAGKYLNKDVEVTTYDGKVRSGTLEKVTHDRIYMAIKLRAGSLTYPVEIVHIDQLKVLF